jgi:hypothetical protein
VTFSGLGDLGRSVVGEAAVGAAVVGVDVGADGGAGFVERLELLPPDPAQLELGKLGLDERLALRVAVAAALVRDPMV